MSVGIGGQEFCQCRKTLLGNVNTGVDFDWYDTLREKYEEHCEMFSEEKSLAVGE